MANMLFWFRVKILDETRGCLALPPTRLFALKVSQTQQIIKMKKSEKIKYRFPYEWNLKDAACCHGSNIFANSLTMVAIFKIMFVYLCYERYKNI